MAAITKDMTFPKGLSHAETRTVCANRYARERRNILSIRPNLILGGYTYIPLIKGRYDSSVIDVQNGLRNVTKEANPELIALIGDEKVCGDLDAQQAYEVAFERTLVESFGKALKGVYHFEMDPVSVPKITAFQSDADLLAVADSMEADLKKVRAAIENRKNQ